VLVDPPARRDRPPRDSGKTGDTVRDNQRVPHVRYNRNSALGNRVARDLQVALGVGGVWALVDSRVR
jgi:hypothetical protein